MVWDKTENTCKFGMSAIYAPQVFAMTFQIPSKSMWTILQLSIAYNGFITHADRFFVLSLFIIWSRYSGLLIGTLTMEYGGTVKIECEKTGYHTEIEFKLKVKKQLPYSYILKG